MKSKCLKVIKFYYEYPEVLKDFEEKFYYPIFKNRVALHENHFNMGFMYKLINNFPAPFISSIVENLSNRFDENKDLIAKVLKMLNDDPFISVIATNNLDPNESLQKIPGVSI
jgi:hypothetical protein